MKEVSIIDTGEDALGKFKGGVGGLTGDTGTHVDGKLDQASGKAQKAFGSPSETLRDGVVAISAGLSEWAGQAGKKLSGATFSAKEISGELVERASNLGGRAGHYVEETVEKMPFLLLIGLTAIAYGTAYLFHSPSTPFAPKPRKFLQLRLMFGTKTADEGRGFASDLRNEASACGREVLASGKDGLGQMSTRVEGAVAEIAALVDDYPLAAVGVAVGHGLAVGLHGRRKRPS